MRDEIVTRNAHDDDRDDGDDAVDGEVEEVQSLNERLSYVDCVRVSLE